MASGSVEKIEMASVILILVVSSGRPCHPNQYTAKPEVEEKSVSTVSTSTYAKSVGGKACVNTVVFAEHANHVEGAASASTAKTNIFASSVILNVRLVRTAGSSTSARNAMVKAYANTVDAGQIVQSVRVPACVSTEYIVTDASIAEDVASVRTAACDGSAKSAREAFIAFTKKSSSTVRFAMDVAYASMV